MCYYLVVMYVIRLLLVIWIKVAKAKDPKCQARAGVYLNQGNVFWGRESNREETYIHKKLLLPAKYRKKKYIFKF